MTKTALILVLSMGVAHAAARSHPQSVAMCESDDGHLSIEITKTSKFLADVTNGSTTTKDIALTRQKKAEKAKDRIADWMDGFEGSSKQTGEFTLQVSEVMGEAGHEATFHDRSGDRTVRCHYEPEFEPK